MTAAIANPTFIADTPPAPAADDRTVRHGTFVLERTYRQSPQVVFDAWKSREAKLVWFANQIDFLQSVTTYELDFRVGGREYLDGLLSRGRRFEYDSTYADIVDGRRLVAGYDVRVDGVRLSTSVMTVEFEPSAGGGTHLILTEQGAFFDGIDSNSERVKGADDMLTEFDRYMDTMR
ncbi:MAG TPA: SRPBCC domain-containing protein [Candidatus Limnocylindrales bacterium]